MHRPKHCFTPGLPVVRPFAIPASGRSPYTKDVAVNTKTFLVECTLNDDSVRTPRKKLLGNIQIYLCRKNYDEVCCLLQRDKGFVTFEVASRETFDSCSYVPGCKFTHIKCMYRNIESKLHENKI